MKIILIIYEKKFRIDFEFKIFGCIGGKVEIFKEIRRNKKYCFVVDVFWL